MAAKLRGLGFEVSAVEDVDRRELGKAVNDFLRRVRGSDAAVLIYYSGHGLQVGGYRGAGSARCAYRGNGHPGFRGVSLGLRLLRTP